jgi:hypothetical protein
MYNIVFIQTDTVSVVGRHSNIKFTQTIRTHNKMFQSVELVELENKPTLHWLLMYGLEY